MATSRGIDCGVAQATGQLHYLAISQEPDSPTRSSSRRVLAAPPSAEPDTDPAAPARLPLAADKAAALLMALLLLAAAACAWHGSAGATSRWWREPLHTPPALRTADGRVELWAQTARFQTISEGSCADMGLKPITDRRTCKVAAKGLGLMDTSVQVTPDLGRPEGCYFLKNEVGETLWLSTNRRNHGNGASGVAGYSRNPICIDHIAVGDTLPGAVPSAAESSTAAGGQAAAAALPTTTLRALRDGAGDGLVAHEAAEAMAAAATAAQPAPADAAVTPVATAAPREDAGYSDLKSSPALKAALAMKALATAASNVAHGAEEAAAAAAAAGPQVSAPVVTTTTPEPLFKSPSKKAILLSCLRWKQDGCYMITDKENCLRSRDGRTAITWKGKRIHGQPCVWCGGKSCTKTAATLCEPYDWVVKSASFNMSLARNTYETASCPDIDSTLIPTLFCFSLMLPYGYELNLVRSQLEKGVGIFNCDEFVVFSNKTLLLSRQGQEEVVTLPIAGNLSATYGGKWGTALNTDIFIRVWNAVSMLGRYQYHDWTVKLDPDAVFFPERLKELLMRKPTSSVPRAGNHSMNANCGTCKLEKYKNSTCTSRIQSMQASGATCEEALAKAARQPPADCGCDCGDLACNVSSTSMYVNNCKWGLHGPIEVISREAVATYIANLNNCEHIRRQPFGEDKYLRRCLDELGVQKVNEYSLLRELACGQTPAPCTAANVAFHPFKDVQGYFDCWSHAKSLGTWP